MSPSIAVKSIPKFNISVKPEGLFPMTKVATEIKGAPKLVIEAHEFTQDKINLWLSAGGGQRGCLLGLRIEQKSEITIALHDFEFRGGLKDLICNERTDWHDINYGDSLKPRRFYNLNPWADITHWYVDSSLRGKGVGKAWYMEHLEPYLIKCGFGIVAIHGQCLDSKETLSFWRSMGFTGDKETNTNGAHDADSVVEYITFKKLSA